MATLKATALQALKDFFPKEDLKTVVIAQTKDKTNKKATFGFYVDARAIMDRLDEVCGPENWKEIYKSGPDGGVLCGISIKIEGVWVTKWDGAPNTNIEAVKGGLSTSFRRAAVKWGIGRYLYDVPMSAWVPMNHGKPVKPLTIPGKFLPGDKRRAAKVPDSIQTEETQAPDAPSTTEPRHLNSTELDIWTAAIKGKPKAKLKPLYVKFQNRKMSFETLMKNVEQL